MQLSSSLVEQSEAVMFKISSLKRVSAFAVAATLLSSAGCVRSQPAFVPAPQQVNVTRTNPLQGESLHARTGQINCRLGSYHLHSANFSVSGVSKGPLSGSFTATGSWTWRGDKQNVFAGFGERFTLNIRSSKISYDMRGFAASNPAKFNCRIFSSHGFWLTYGRPHNHRGSASAYILTNGRFEETFH